MLLGLAAGKVGDLVFYRDGGEQRTRTRVIPKNPRSPLQMAQRVRIANVAALYRLLAPIVRDSFSNRPSNQSGYNAMASGAIELSPFMTKEMANADAVLPMPAVISKGVLPAVNFSIDAADFNAIAISVAGLPSGSSANVGAVSQAIIAAYPAMQDGDKLTFVELQFAVDSSFDFDLYKGTPTIREFVLDTTSAESLPSFLRAESTAGLLAAQPSGAILDNVGIYAVSVMVSRVDESGSLQTSFARLELGSAAQTLYDGYRTEQALLDAIESYNAGSESILR